MTSEESMHSSISRLMNRYWNKPKESYCKCSVLMTDIFENLWVIEFLCFTILFHSETQLWQLIFSLLLYLYEWDDLVLKQPVSCFSQFTFHNWFFRLEMTLLFLLSSRHTVNWPMKLDLAFAGKNLAPLWNQVFTCILLTNVACSDGSRNL